MWLYQPHDDPPTKANKADAAADAPDDKADAPDRALEKWCEKFKAREEKKNLDSGDIVWMTPLVFHLAFLVYLVLASCESSTCSHSASS